MSAKPEIDSDPKKNKNGFQNAVLILFFVKQILQDSTSQPRCRCKFQKFTFRVIHTIQHRKYVFSHPFCRTWRTSKETFKDSVRNNSNWTDDLHIGMPRAVSWAVHFKSGHRDLYLRTVDFFIRLPWSRFSDWKNSKANVSDFSIRRCNCRTLH